MAYGKIYTTNWWTDRYANEFQLFISKKNYTGSTSNFKLIDGYSLNNSYKGGRDAENVSVHGSALDFSIWTQPEIQLFNDINFDNGFNVWKTQVIGGLGWYYIGANMATEADAGDTTDFLYQDIVIKSGGKYKLVCDYVLTDGGTNHEFGINFANSNPLSGNQFYPCNVDDETFDGVTTITFTASGNYTKAGLIMTAGGATLQIRSIKLYELGTDYSALMEADYNEYKTTLIHKRQLAKNPTFINRTSNSIFDNWSPDYDGSGSFSWEYNTTYKSLYVVADGLSRSDILAQDNNLVKSQVYKFKIKFTLDNNWNQSKLYLNLYQDPYYDPSTNLILISGNSTPSYLRSGVSIITSHASTDIPFGTYYEIEYTFTSDNWYSAFGFSFSSGDEAIYIHSFECRTDETVFTGWVKPDNITKRFLNEQYFININSICGLADLKNFEYFVDPNYSPIIKVLEDVLNYTGLGLPFLIQNNIYDGAYSNLWYNTLVDKRRWITDKKGKKTYASAYKVLEDILKPFHGQLKQFNGCWLIQNPAENNTTRYVYQTGSTKYTGSVDRIVDITNYAYIPASDEVSKIQPAKGVNVSIDNVQVDDSFVTNGRFDSNVSGWTRHGEVFSTWARVSADEDAYLRTRRTSANDFTTMYFSGQTYLPNPSITVGLGDSFTISMDIMIITPTTDSLKPELRINAWRDYTTNIGEQRTIPLSTTGEYPANTWIKISEDFQTWSDMATHFPTPLKVDIGIFTPAAANGQTIEIYFDNIKLEYEFAKDVDDKTRYSIELETNNPLLQTITEELNFGDGYYTNDLSVIKLPNGKNSTVWRNADSSITGVTLVELFARERLRQNLTYKDYIRCSVIDEGFNIRPNSIVKLFDKQYKIVGYARNFLLAQVDLELIELKIGTIPDVQDSYYPSFTAFDY